MGWSLIGQRDTGSVGDFRLGGALAQLMDLWLQTGQSRRLIGDHIGQILDHSGQVRDTLFKVVMLSHDDTIAVTL